MSWIKRNLYFVIGSALALLLMGLAGWYFYSKWQLNGDVMAKLKADYNTLDDLNKQNPHPGYGAINNDQVARQQREELLTFIAGVRKHFSTIPQIPEPVVTKESFSAALSRTIEQLRRDATNESVTLPASYNFSFAAQDKLLKFAPGSLEPLSIQLGEIKTICDILFRAKINAFDGIRRVKVSADDQQGNPSDYLADRDKSLTNDLAQAVITPYEVTFRCFSQELAAVVAGLAGSPYSFVIKALNVVPAPASALLQEQAAPAPDQSTFIQAQESLDRRAALQRARDRMLRRYGPAAGPRRPEPQPMAPSFGQPSPPPKTGPGIVLDEKQLQVVMALDVIKLMEPKPVASPKGPQRPGRPTPAPASAPTQAASN